LRLWILLGAGTAAVAAVGGVPAWFLAPAESGQGVPRPVSHVDTATRACLLTSMNTDPAGAGVVVQRYRLPGEANGVAYVNTLVQPRCSTIVTTGAAARSAVASTLVGGIPKVSAWWWSLSVRWPARCA
jgi:hypothetical protein